MRTYLILKEKVARWNASPTIKTILQEISATPSGTPKIARHSKAASSALLAHVFDKDAMAQKRLPYELLDQLTVDILLGAA